MTQQRAIPCRMLRGTPRLCNITVMNSVHIILKYDGLMSSHIIVHGPPGTYFIYDLSSYSVLEVCDGFRGTNLALTPIQTWLKDSTVATLVAQFIAEHFIGDLNVPD